MFWMRSVFQEDAAEHTLEYLHNGIKKSRNVAPRIIVRRVKQLSSYITYLPGVYYSSQATSQTTRTKRLTDPQVAQLALRLCPPAWKTAWKMLKKGMPQDLEELVQFMELQESAEKSSMAKAKAQNNNGSQNGNQAGSNKRKGNSGQNGGSSKKAKKHCDLCAKNGGPANSHNTEDCRIYQANGSKKGQSRGDKKSNHCFTQLEKKLEKTEKKLDKMSKKMDRQYKKRSKEEESETDSDA